MKEHDLNPDARLYGILTLPARVHFVSSESKLAEGVFKYLNSQGMLEKEVELIGRQRAIDSLGDTAGIFVCIHIGVGLCLLEPAHESQG
eukprot:2826404-Amphidinium_carterae.1